MMTQRNGSETGGKKALLLAGSCVGDGLGGGGLPVWFPCFFGCEWVSAGGAAFGLWSLLQAWVADLGVRKAGGGR